VCQGVLQYLGEDSAAAAITNLGQLTRSVLYLEVPYRLLPAMQRSQIHRRIGHFGESIYGERVGEIASELVMHFDQGLDSPRAVKYLLQAAENAASTSAWDPMRRACLSRSAGARRLPATPGAIGRSEPPDDSGRLVDVNRGFAAAEVEDVCERALALMRAARRIVSSLHGAMAPRDCSAISARKCSGPGHRRRDAAACERLQNPRFVIEARMQ
jgi:hypothetical protein